LPCFARAAGKRIDCLFAILQAMVQLFCLFKPASTNLRKSCRDGAVLLVIPPHGIEVSQERIGAKEEMTALGIQDGDALADINWDSERQHR
jgi:hypothetical protein